MPKTEESARGMYIRRFWKKNRNRKGCCRTAAPFKILFSNVESRDSCKFKNGFFGNLLPRYSTKSSISPVKMSLGSYFFKIILSSSTKISRGSLSFTLRLRRSSIGSVILPSSSNFLTIPVLFMILPPYTKSL